MRKESKVTPLLSVCLITYNHVNYIKEAIDGVLMQKVNFSWEFIIADDCSTDGTREVLIEYKQKHPHLIRLILQEKNVGPAKNWFDLINAPTGKYVAYFEGDDFWTDPYKLQKQVDHLEEHSNIVGCFSDTYVVNETGNILHDAIPEVYKREIPIDEVGDFWMPTVSVCLRTKSFAELINYDVFINVVNGDMFIYYLMAQRGNFAYVQTIPSHYRQHSNGIWTRVSIIERYKRNIETDYKIFDSLRPANRKYIIPRFRANYSWQLNHYKKNEHISAIVGFLKYNFPALINRKKYGLAISIMFQSFYVLGLRIRDKVKRMVR